MWEFDKTFHILYVFFIIIIIDQLNLIFSFIRSTKIIFLKNFVLDRSLEHIVYIPVHELMVILNVYSDVLN